MQKCKKWFEASGFGNLISKSQRSFGVWKLKFENIFCKIVLAIPRSTKPIVLLIHLLFVYFLFLLLFLFLFLFLVLVLVCFFPCWCDLGHWKYAFGKICGKKGLIILMCCLNSTWGVLRFELDRGVPLEPQNPYPPSQIGLFFKNSTIFGVFAWRKPRKLCNLGLSQKRWPMFKDFLGKKRDPCLRISCKKATH